MKSIQEYTILWNATESGTFIIQHSFSTENYRSSNHSFYQKVRVVKSSSLQAVKKFSREVKEVKKF
ncbi:CLUMA_CG020697, isoform A [Clunio marinus]|uniref:CLUMA_CG020697, isoform A n=1 Tax=Clunio marinus TaxID=568069 RepID=A0A1J1J5S1_9DIPT|nr:CLUMA_CG020697, isoform A [Clunio marinus]